MISVNGIEYLKIISMLHSNVISGGVLYLISMNDAIAWRQASNEFDLGIFKVGDKLSKNSIAGRAMKEKRTLIENVPRSLYGIRLKTVAEPIVDDNGNSVGAFSIVLPRLHPVAKAFNDFAPIISEMFAEGALIYVTDLQKI
ncbi:MAG: methyl-accepting chemotaxis protein, partial [Bacillota bacterium]|nr:methyl-accepting chemotaxis protein [Bacillota bacterium]